MWNLTKILNQYNLIKYFSFFRILSSVLLSSFLQCLFAATNICSLNNETLSRNKRFLVFPPTTGTSILKFVSGYLGPIDIPIWQNINCLRNFQFQYSLPTTWATKIPTFPGFPKQARSFSDNEVIKDKKPIKSDSTRKIAYELIEEILDK